jgi:guanylate kinase
VPKGKLLVISGPSAGVGKDTILKLFMAKHPDWQHPPSVTTRSPRAGEVEGVDYIFISRKEFKDKISKSEFMEWEETAGNYYGTLKTPIEDLLNNGQSIIIRKDVRGALSVKKLQPHAITICLLPDEWASLEKRFRSRATESEEEIKARLKLAKQELKLQSEFDHMIINPHGQPEKALAEVEKAVGL